MYISYITPLLEYGDVIWDTHIKSLTDKLENVQYEAARIVTGGTILTALDKLYQETGWEKLSKRRGNHILILFYKIINKDSPQYLQNMIPYLVADQHQHNTRQWHNIVERRTYTNYCANYFYQLL